MFRPNKSGRYKVFDRHLSDMTYQTEIGASLNEVGGMIIGLWKEGNYKEATAATLMYPFIVFSAVGNSKAWLRREPVSQN